MRSRWQTTLASAVLILFGVAGTIACGSSEGRPDEELGGLVIAPKRNERAVNPGRLADSTSELLTAATMPHRKVGELLGGHVFEGSSKIEVTEGGETVLSLSDTTRILYREDGSYHALLENSRDYGRAAFYVDGEMLLAPRHGKFHKRPPADKDEPARIRDEIFATLGSQLELVVHAAELSDLGGTNVAGRAGLTVKLELAPTPGKPPKQKLPRETWRETILVKTLSGELTFDADNGAPLQGKLEASLSFSRDGRSFLMTLAVTHGLSAIGSDPELELPPAEAIVTVGDHHQEASERENLLRGIAPPARKSPTPANTLPGAKGGRKKGRGK